MEIIKDEKTSTETYHTCERCGFDRIKHDHKFCGICGLPQKKTNQDCTPS